MNLFESLLDALNRLDGDALVMHVGEKPYVVTASTPLNAFRGPLLWGQVELSSNVLTYEALLRLLGETLSRDQREALDQLGAVKFEIPPMGPEGVHYTLIAARGGEDVWLEVRRHRPAGAAASAPHPAARAASTPVSKHEMVEEHDVGLISVEQIVRAAAARGASTVYVVANAKPMVRLGGDVTPLDGQTILAASDIERLVTEMAPGRGLTGTQPVEWTFDVPGVGHVRCVAFRDQRGPGIMFRIAGTASLSERPA